MSEFQFPSPPEPLPEPFYKRIPKTYLWWGLGVLLMGFAIIILPSQCGADSLGLPERKSEDLQSMSRVDQDKDLEFRDDELWYKVGDEIPFTGLAIAYHDNGKIRSQTKIKEGAAYGLIEEWDRNGTRLGTNFKNEFQAGK